MAKGERGRGPLRRRLAALAYDDIFIVPRVVIKQRMLDFFFCDLVVRGIENSVDKLPLKVDIEGVRPIVSDGILHGAKVSFGG